MREGPVSGSNGLSLLKVCVSREDDPVSLCGEGEQSSDHSFNPCLKSGDGLKGPKPKIGGHLIVPGSSSMELTSHRASDLAKEAFDKRVDVLIGRI
jgi:hypothetical protein